MALKGKASVQSPNSAEVLDYWTYFKSCNAFQTDTHAHHVSVQTCMLGLIHDEVWIGSQDSIIYIMDTHTMSCNKQLTEHRHEVTGLTADPTGGQNRWVYFF